MISVTAQSESQPNKAKNILTASELKVFNERSNKDGLIQLSKHLCIMTISGYLWLIPKPSNLLEYIAEISGYNWWLGKFKTHYRLATGKLDNMPYIAENARDEVIRSNRLQLAVYGIAIALSIAARQPWFITYWLLPLAVGQPILRFILLAEHTGCTKDNNPLANTRTTLTWFPLRMMMWNIPFHALPKAHQELKEHFAVVDDGYLKVNQKIVSSF